MEVESRREYMLKLVAMMTEHELNHWHNQIENYKRGKAARPYKLVDDIDRVTGDGRIELAMDMIKQCYTLVKYPTFAHPTTKNVMAGAGLLNPKSQTDMRFTNAVLRLAKFRQAKIKDKEREGTWTRIWKSVDAHEGSSLENRQRIFAKHLQLTDLQFENYSH